MRTIPKYAAYAIVLVGAFIMLAPFYFMFVFATQSRTDIFNVPPPLWFSGELLNNLKVLTTRLPFWKTSTTFLAACMSWEGSPSTTSTSPGCASAIAA